MHTASRNNGITKAPLLIINLTLAVILSACGGSDSPAPTPPAPADTTPNTFSLSAQTDINLGAVIESNTITVSGINTSSAISITGGEYSIAGAAYTSAAGTVTNTQSITVRQTASTTLATQTDAVLTIGGVSDTFSVTTRSADPGGLYTGTGSVNGGTNNLTAIKGMIQDQRLMLFDVGENVLYDGQIQTYSGGTITAMIDVYKDGVYGQQVTATGTVVNQTSLSLTLSGTGYGLGTLTLTYDVIYERDATLARFTAEALNRWGGTINTVTSGSALAIKTPSGVTNNTFTGTTSNPVSCEYQNGMKTIPNSTVNLYSIELDVSNVTTCNHIGTGYTGFATIVDVGGTDDTMWFAASNGTNSNFSILTYQ